MRLSRRRRAPCCHGIAPAGHTDDDGVIFPFETIVVTADR
jgi:hypothetical protein